VGSNRTLRLDVRVVAATNRNLAAEVEQGRFRSDLYYRLNVIPLRLQPLRERREDIPLLVERILKQARFNRRADGGLRVEAVGEAAMAQLQAHGWPGNVRELVNVLEREVSLAAAGEIGEISAGSLRGEGWCEDAGQARAEAGSGGHDLAAGVPGSYREERERVMKEFEERYFAGLLESAGGSVAKASRLAGVDRKHLRHLLKKRGLRGGGEPG
jgi:two-component system nitrogen regulation response regulator NtrX